MRDFNAMTQTVAILTVVIYVALYTPLKKFSWINTPVGAIPGALPLLGGWFAAEATFAHRCGCFIFYSFLLANSSFLCTFYYVLRRLQIS